MGLTVAALIVALAGWLLPCLRFSTPVTPPEHWLTWQVAVRATGLRLSGQPTPNQRLAQWAGLEREWQALAASAPGRHAVAPGRGWKWEMARGIAWAIAAAAWLAVLTAVALALRRERLAATLPIAGVAAAGYAAVAGYAATLLARAELRHALFAMRRRLPFTALLPLRLRPLELATGPGVWVMLAAFVALLLVATPEQARRGGQAVPPATSGRRPLRERVRLAFDGRRRMPADEPEPSKLPRPDAEAGA